MSAHTACVDLLYWARGVAALREVAFIVTADEVGASPPLHEAAVLLIKLGATNVLSKPIPQEEFIRMRQTITRSQSLSEQRQARRTEGGARAVSDILVARQMATGRVDGGKDEP